MGISPVLSARPSSCEVSTTARYAPWCCVKALCWQALGIAMHAGVLHVASDFFSAQILLVLYQYAQFVATDTQCRSWEPLQHVLAMQSRRFHFMIASAKD